MLIIKEYTKEDFETGTAPFEEVYQYYNKDPFMEGRTLQRLAEVAKKLKVVGFKNAYKDYVKSIKIETSLAETENITKFDDQEMELNTGEWNADDSGVWKYGSFGNIEIACSHPITPIERLENIDTGEMKVKIAFRRGNKNRRSWNEILTDFDTVANAKNIVSLAKVGISVTSGKRAQNLVDYISEVMDKNYDLIPKTESVSRMGWNRVGFSPYVDGVVFDGNESFGKTFRAIREHGNFGLWLNEAVNVRKYSLTAKIVLASSFASALVEPMGCLPFFVHLWGMDSGTGKSVAQMVAASVWADPFIGGDYFKTFKSTGVGFEVMAGFLNSLPVFIDELQLAKDSRGKLIFNVYELASGSGKLRSNKTLGLASSLTWANCFITSGESPITGENDGAGALNRVIEVECLASNKVVEDGHKTANIVKQNYGFAGKIFVEELCKDGVIESVKEKYEFYFEQFSKMNTTEKQAHSASLIVLANELATRWVFKDKNAITVEQMSEFLKSKETVSAADRGYNFMCDWVAQNVNKLCGKSELGEVYGNIGKGDDDGYVYIVRSVWNRVCQENKISAPALLSHLRSRGLIQTRGKGLTKTKRINDIPTECVVMKLGGSEDWVEVDPKEIDLPF